jgi:hypothetical protein
MQSHSDTSASIVRSEDLVHDSIDVAPEVKLQRRPSVSGAEPSGIHLNEKGEQQYVDYPAGQKVVSLGEKISYGFTSAVDWMRNTLEVQGPIAQEKLGNALVKTGEVFSNGFSKSVDYSRTKLAETGEKITEKINSRRGSREVSRSDKDMKDDLEGSSSRASLSKKAESCVVAECSGIRQSHGHGYCTEHAAEFMAAPAKADITLPVVDSSTTIRQSTQPGGF